MPNYAITPVAPAFGLRVSAAPDTVTISINDHGGRGWPWAVIFVPVVQKDNKFHVLIQKAENPPPYAPDDLLKASYWQRQKKHSPPYNVSSNRSDWVKAHTAPWPFDTGLVLTLLLYFQSPGVGEEPLIESLLNPEDDPEYRHEVAEKVGDCLAKSTVNDLRGGLIARRAAVGPPDAGKTPATPPKAPPTLVSEVTFSLASCLYPSDIFDRMPDDTSEPGPADASLLALGKRLGKPGAPSLLLFVGDQVYVDATAGLFDPKVQDDRYRLPYEYRGGSRGVKAALQYSDVDVYMMPDDHEIIDNWEPGAPTPKGEKPAIELGTAAYWKYQRFDSPPAPIWRAIVHGKLPFFLGDARTGRQGRTAMNWREQKIMDDDQFKALCTWMKNKNETELPMFVTTASAVLPRRLAVARDPACALHSDAWDGYPKSLHDLLAYVCDNQIKGLVFLSGDEHISNFVEARVTKLVDGKDGNQCTLHSVHSSALYAPYPFANAVQEDFARNETFLFTDSKASHYRCEVRTVFAPEGDGFALLTARQSIPGWQLEVVFHDAHGPKHVEPYRLDLFPRVE